MSEIVQPDPQYLALYQIVQRESSVMLVESIRDRVFVPPLVDTSESRPLSRATKARNAPKIKDEHHHIDWSTWTAGDICLRQRILGDVWSCATARLAGKQVSIRLKFTRPMTVLDGNSVRLYPEIPVGYPYYAALAGLGRNLGHKKGVIVNTCDGKALHINELRPENERSQDPLGPSIRLGLTEEMTNPGQDGQTLGVIWKYINPLH